MNYKFKTKPYAHQLDALEASWDKENFAYFMEMGTGKSKVLLDNAAVLYDKGLINGLLLIAPKGVYKNWYDSEIPTHLPDHIEKKVVLWKTSDKSKKQQKILNTMFETGTDFHILIMNVESFSKGDGIKFAQKFLIYFKRFFFYVLLPKRFCQVHQDRGDKVIRQECSNDSRYK